jgi:hypothetical protein
MAIKPKWEDAPGWAEYLAMDLDGQWFWYESKPVKKLSFWDAQPNTKTASPKSTVVWTDTIETRPEM